MDKLAAIRIYDGQDYSDEIPVTALAENVQWDESSTLIDILGSISLTRKGNIQNQIDELNNRINNIHGDVVSVNGKTGTVVLNAADVGAGTGNYNKPISGIPKTDLASSVQASLGKADTALQSYTETDPTVPAWAKQPNKPTYTAQEVGALPADSQITVEVDDTLSIQGAAADAKAVGDALASNTNVSRVIASTYNDSNTYNIGSLVLYNGLLYRCRTKIETPEAWTRVHWDLLTIDKSLTPLELGQLWSTCNTAENTLDKVTSIFSYDDTQYNPKPFGIIGIYFYNAVPANSTLNINNTGAKPIYKGLNPIGDNEIKAGDTAYFMLNGIGRFEFLGVDSYGIQIKTIKQDLEIQQSRAETAQALKINKPITNPNGTNGQILQTDGQGGTSWVDELTDEQITDAVTDWLDDHVVPGSSTIVVDDTLNIQGAAADAKKTGDEITALKEDLSHIVGVPNTVRQAIADLLHSAAFTATGMTENLSIVDDWASVTATAIALSQYTIDFVGNGSQQLTAILSPPDSTDTVTWASSDTTVATVTQNGLVTAVGNGTCNVTASVGQLVATCAVTATGITVSYTITNTLTKAVNSNTDTVIAGGDPYSGTISGTTGYTVADADIAVTMGGEAVSGAVSGGVITIAEVTGNVVITATGTLKGTNMMTAVTSGNWHLSADTGITDASGGDFVATNINDRGLSWNSNVIQNNLTVKSNALTSKTLFLECDIEISGSTSENDKTIFSLSAFDRASPTTGGQRKGTYDYVVYNSGHYVFEIPVSETEIQLSSSYYFGLMVFFYGPKDYKAEVSNLVYTYY